MNVKTRLGEHTRSFHFNFPNIIGIEDHQVEDIKHRLVDHKKKALSDKSPEFDTQHHRKMLHLPPIMKRHESEPTLQNLNVNSGRKQNFLPYIYAQTGYNTNRHNPDHLFNGIYSAHLDRKDSTLNVYEGTKGRKMNCKRKNNVK